MVPFSFDLRLNCQKKTLKESYWHYNIFPPEDGDFTIETGDHLSYKNKIAKMIIASVMLLSGICSYVCGQC